MSQVKDKEDDIALCANNNTKTGYLHKTHYLDQNQKAYPVYVRIPESAVINQQLFDFDNKDIPKDGIYRDIIEHPRSWYPVDNNTESRKLAEESLLLLFHSPTKSFC